MGEQDIVSNRAVFDDSSNLNHLKIQLQKQSVELNETRQHLENCQKGHSELEQSSAASEQKLKNRIAELKKDLEKLQHQISNRSE